ncbi:MAG: OmpA family protein [Phycisphaerales bacterium]
MSEEKDHHGEEEGHGGGGHGGGGHGGHGGGGGHAEHEEGVPEWVVSFADNALLQMGFFAILLALNMGAKASGPTSEGNQTSAASAKNSMYEFVLAVRAGFNNPVDPNGSNPKDEELRQYMRRRSEAGDTREPGPDGNKKDAQTIRPGDYKQPDGYIEFDDQSTELTEVAREAVRELAAQNKGMRFMLEIRGHASTREGAGDIKRARELSYERAWAFGSALVSAGLRWEQLRLVACGDSDPVKARATGSEHQNNQRAEMFVLPEAMPPDPFSRDGDEP